MVDYTDKNDEEFNMEHIANSTLDVVEKNKIIRGEVVTIDEEFAYINVGTKSEGRVSLEEFEQVPDVGDIIDIMLVNKRLLDGMYIFSRNAAEQEKRWKKFIDQYNEGNRYITARIKSSIKNGMIIDCDGLNAFLPFSLAEDIKFKKNKENLDPVTFKIIDVDEKKQNIVVSRKEYLDEERKKHWDSFRSDNEIGETVTGKVVKFFETGVLVDLGGVEAFLHKDDITWKKVFKKRKILKLDEEREFKILDINDERMAVAIGVKQLIDNPWLSVNEKYTVGDVVTGTVVTITNFGVFLELEEGIEGLVTAANMTWNKKNTNPKDTFKKGQKVEAKILDINKEENRLSLGIKQLSQNPWDTIAEKFSVGSIHKSAIKKVINYGIFVELADDIDGMIHVSDISWEENVQAPSATYSEGDIVEYKILDINKDEMKISCGMKQLLKSPWEIIKENYPVRSKVAGVISGIVPFGLFIKLKDGIEGLVHISEVSNTKIDNLEEHFNTGEQVSAIVLGVDADRKRLSLSIKHYDQIVEKEELDRVLKETSPGKVTIGDMFKGKID